MSNSSTGDIKVPNSPINKNKAEKTDKMIQLERLKALCRTPDSAISMVRMPVHLALQPAYLGNINAGIFSILNKNINKYYPELKGILMGYNKIKLKKRDGSISNDQPFIHIDVQADFYIFNPRKGVTLRGRVNKKSAGHVGCLVHDVFNAAITPPIGQNLSRWCGAQAQIGKQISFMTTAVSFGDKLPIIQGKLEQEGLDIQQDSEEEAVMEVEEFEETRITDYDSGIDSIGKGEKRKREEEDKEETEEERKARKKQKKAEKKKRKEKEREEEENAEREALALKKESQDEIEKIKKKKTKDKTQEIKNVINEAGDTAPKPSTPVKSSENSSKPQTPQTANKVKKGAFELPEGWRKEERGQGTKRIYKVFLSPEGKYFPSLAKVQQFVENAGEKRVEVGHQLERELGVAIKKPTKVINEKPTKVINENLEKMVNFVSSTWNRDFDDSLMSDNPELYKNPALRSMPMKREFFEPAKKPPAKRVPKSPKANTTLETAEPEEAEASLLDVSNAIEKSESKSPERPQTDNNDTIGSQDESMSSKKAKKKKKKKNKERDEESSFFE